MSADALVTSGDASALREQHGRLREGAHGRPAAIKHPARTTQPCQDAALATISTGSEKAAQSRRMQYLGWTGRVWWRLLGPYTGGNIKWQKSLRCKQAGGSRGQRRSYGGDHRVTLTWRERVQQRSIEPLLKELGRRLENGGCRVGEPTVFLMPDVPERCTESCTHGRGEKMIHRFSTQMITKWYACESQGRCVLGGAVAEWLEVRGCSMSAK
jgi:hypothetical protein